MRTIRKQLLVEAPQDTAFRIFTERIDTWWPKTHHVGKTPMTEMVLEPKTKGRWYSRHKDGSEVTVGYVDTWEPSCRLILIWQVDGDFRPNPELITEVEVRFIPEGEFTRVEFEHRNLDRLAAGKAVESMDEGWGMILKLFKQHTDQAIESSQRQQ